MVFSFYKPVATLAHKGQLRSNCCGVPLSEGELSPLELSEGELFESVLGGGGEPTGPRVVHPL